MTKTESKLKTVIAICATIFMSIAVAACKQNPPVQIFKVSYATEMGVAPETIEVQEGYLLAEKDLPILVSDGYTFDGWYDDSTKATPGEYVVSKEVKLIAKWVANQDTSYTVKHLKQNVQLDGYDLEETENLSGTTNQNAAVTLKDYQGFEVGTFAASTISADGSTVVEVKYNRKKYTISFNVDGGSEVESITTAYGATITAPVNPEKDGYYFVKWEPSIPETMPINGAVCKAVWEIKVYYVESSDLSSILSANSGKEVNIKIKNSNVSLDSITTALQNNTGTKVNLDLSECSELTSIGTRLFSNCSGLTSIIIPNSVTSIERNAFWGCIGFTSIIIPNSVTSIGECAFANCTGLTSITIPKSVTSIGTQAFSNCTGVESIVVEDGNSVYDSRNECNAIIETSTNTLISGCKATIIPNSVTSIGESAFELCEFTSITIPNSVTSIGIQAFINCGLTSISIPNSVTWIGESAFCGCTGLTSITIPNSVTSIGRYPFYGCTNLTTVEVPSDSTWTVNGSDVTLLKDDPSGNATKIKSASTSAWTKKE